MTKISIVTPSYQQAAFLESTMRSVLDQTYQGLEYVVMDGGSTDGSRDVIEANADRLAYWVSVRDEGHASSVNEGFRHTTGEIMAWLNSSDVYYPWTLQTVADVFESLPEVMWICGAPSLWSEGFGPKGLARAHLNGNDFAGGRYRWLQQESMFWRRELWEKAGGGVDESLPYAFDLDTWMRFFEHAELVHVGTLLAGYRYHGDRRGADPAYEAEAVKASRAHLSRLGSAARTRGTYARVLGSTRAGRALREMARRHGLAAWDAVPRAEYDYDKRVWVRLT